MTRSSYHDEPIPRWTLRQMGVAELAYRVATLTDELVALRNERPDETYTELVASWLRAYSDELDRRQQRFEAGRGPNPKRRYDEAVAAAAREVAERADLPDIFLRHAVLVTPDRPSNPDAEWHGPCPICSAGRDRLVIFRRELGRPRTFWCRQCGWRGDALTAYRDLGNTTFWEALEALAAETGVPLPEPSPRDQRIAAANAKRALEVGR